MNDAEAEKDMRATNRFGKKLNTSTGEAPPINAVVLTQSIFYVIPGQPACVESIICRICVFMASISTGIYSLSRIAPMSPQE